MDQQSRTPLPSLRPDLDIVADPGCDDGDRYLVRDPATGRVWQIGAAERKVLLLLDGTFSLSGIWNIVSQHEDLGSGSPVTEDELSRFVVQLGHEGLLVSEDGSVVEVVNVRTGVSLRRIVSLPLRAVMRWLVVLPWDILSLGMLSEPVRPTRVRLGNPDPMLAVVARLLRPLLGRPLLVVALAYSAFGIGLLITGFGDWSEAVQILWKPWGLAVVAVTGVLAVHIPHQIAHGIVCSHFGCRVPTWGFRFLFNVIPTFWFDLGDVVWLEEKRKHLAVIGVGLIWQSVALTTGMIGWLVTDRATFGSIVFLALSSTALFGFVLNFNPLAQRDGYQMLAVWLEIADLRGRAREYLRAWVQWRPVPEPLTRRERYIFGTYAAAVNLFGVFLALVGGMFALRMTERHDETGAISVVFAAGLVFQDHIRTVFEHTGVKSLARRTPRVARWGLGIAAVIAVVWVLLLPYPYRAGGDCVLEPDQMVDIRPETEGLIDQVFVREGQWVEVGDPVASLVTHIQERNLYASEARLAESKAQRSALLAGTRPEEIHRAQAIVSTAEAKLVWSTARAERYTELYKEEIVGRQEYENAVQLQQVNSRELEEAKAYLELVKAGARPETLEAAKAEVESLEAVVDHYRGDLERTMLFSPIAGQITTPRVEMIRGRYLKPGQRDLVATIKDTRTVVAEVLVPEEDVDGVMIGNEVTLVTWSYPERAFIGRVREIAPQATTDELTRRTVVRVLTEIPNPQGELKPEMTGFAKIETTTRPVYDVLFRPLWRWIRIEAWSWIP